jgi:hypothetical protein
MIVRHSRGWSALRVGLTFVALGMSTASAAPVKLVEGTAVRVRITERIGSGDMKEDAPVPMEVAADVFGPSHELLIAKGAPVVATIRRSAHEDFLGKPGELAFTIDATHAVNGSRIPLRGDVARRGRNTAYFGLGAVFARGGNVKLKKGTTYTALVDRDTIIDPSTQCTTVETPVADVPVKASAKRLTLQLKNGDKISGATDGLRDNVYTVVTSYGTLTIPVSDVISYSEN